MAKRKKKAHSQPETPSVPIPERAPEPVAPEPVKPTTLTLLDAQKPTPGSLFGIFGDRTENSEIAGSRFDSVQDSTGRYISANDRVNMWGNPFRGVTLSCGGNTPAVDLFLEHSANGLFGYMRSPAPGDVETRATIAPEIFKTLLESQMIKATGKTLQQHGAATEDAMTLNITSSPLEGLCSSPIVQQAIKKSAEIQR